MAYNFLDKNFNSIGILTNTGGQLNSYWGDQITHSIATSNDVLTSVSLSIDKATTDIDTNGNQKEWNHTIQGLSFGIDGVGKDVSELNYVVYQDGDQGHYYLMTITQVDESLTTSGFHFKTVQGINSAAYDLSRKTLKPMDFAIVPTGTQKVGSVKNILNYIFSDLGWDVRAVGNFPTIDYTITDSVSAQSVLQDVIKLFDAEVDAHVLINNISGGSNVFTGAGSIKRIFEFSTSIGNDNGDVVRLNRNLVSLTKTGARDSLYTKLYVTGSDIDIAPANNGANFIYDDNANKKYNSIGANSTPVQYLEGVINNSGIKDPQALLTWGKKQLKALNHPRYNYNVTSVDGKNVHLGDDVVVQDLKASQPIILKSKIISKTISFADPQTDSFILGEFSPIVIPTRNNDNKNIVQMINKANQVATEALNKSENNHKGLSDLTETVGKVQEQVIQAVVSADSKSVNYYQRNEPANPKEGDTWFWDDGTNSGIRVFTNGKWVDSVDTKTLERINNAVDSAIESSKAYTDELNEKQVQNTNALNEKVNKSVKELTDSQQAISSQATAYADSAVADANAKAVQIGQTTAKNAQSALSAAKSSLSSAITSQATATSSLVSAVDSNASKYATQAKSEAVSAAKTADGVVRSDFKKTTDSISTTITQNKSDADGKIQTAQTTATQALDGLATKVSQTEYNIKTGQLQTDLTATTQTANQAKTDIVSIKQKDGEQDEKMNSIVSDVNGTKQTVSDLQTVQGKQSGDISTLQSRADGFEATVTKVNNLSVGGRNFLTDTNKDVSITSHTTDTWPAWAHIDTGFSFENGKTYTFSAEAKNSTDKIAEASIRVLEKSTNTQVGIYAFPADGKRHSVTFTIPNDSHNYRLLFYAGHAGISPGVDLTTTYHHLKLEAGNIATDWTPAPEDLESATAKAQLTADNATLSINNYKTDADGRISKAQADIIANANAITQKVSQSDYNAKTGELTTSVSKAQQTADTATQTIGTYEETNDKRVSAAETNIKTNSDAILQTVSKTDFDKATGKISGDISTLQQRADGFEATVTKVNDFAVGGRNFLLGTGDWSGGSDRWEYRTSQIDGTYRGMVISATSDAWGNNAYRMQNSEVLQIGKTYTFSVYVRNTSDTDATIGYYYDANVISPHGVEQKLPAHSDWSRIFGTFKVISDPTKSFNVLSWQSINDVTNGQIQFAGYKLEEGNVPTDWTPAPEDVDTKLAQVKITADGVYNVVSDPTTGLSTRMQTAEGALSKVQGIDIPALKNATFWQSYSSLNFNDYTKQGSFFFNTTAVKTNGPVSGNNSWLYLMVDQGTSDNSRIKQTVWYDGVTGVKVTYVRTLNSGTWSPWYANDNDSVTTISQTNSSIKQEISDRQTGDNNTLQSAKDFTTSQITSYDTGMQSRLTQVSDGIMAQVSAINLVTDSSFINGIANWNKFGNGVWAVDGSNSYYGINVVSFYDFNHTGKHDYLTSQDIYTNTFPSKKIYAYVDVNVSRTGGSGDDFVEVYIAQYNNSGTQVKFSPITSQIKTSTNGWKRYTQEIDIDQSATHFALSYHAVGNLEAYIARPYAGVTQLTENGYIAGPNNNNKTNLSLFYNFFSLGIQSNTGALISGINGDDSGLNIVGKKITVSGDTTFIGKNFMDGAIIKNASIGSAQIADAAITNAKISNLDVNKLSGNVSNFIQSNWNGKYGSTTINSTGMTVNSGGVITDFMNSGMKLTMAGESVGGIGVQGLTGKPNTYQGLTFWLDGNAEYMAWSARNNGDTSMNPVIQMSWYRSNSAPTGAYAGFNFDDDVIFNKGINVPGVAKEQLGFTTKQFNNFNYPYFGDSRLQAGLAYGSSYTYLISGTTYYNLTRVIKALDNLGAVKIPSVINSDGTVKKWFSVTL